MENLREYFLGITGARSERAMAARAGIDQSTLNRQLKGGVTVETVVSICRAYELPLAPVFVHVGFLTQDEADRFSDAFQLARFTDLELAREIVRRLEAGEAGPELTEPIDSDPEPAPIVQIGRDVGGPRQDLPEAAWGSEIDHTQDTDDYDA